MSLPIILRKRVEEAFEELERSNSGDLKPYTRLNLYKAFGISIDLSGQLYKQFLNTKQLELSDEYKKYINLAILTTQHILPIWNKYKTDLLVQDDTLQVEMPGNMLEMAKSILQLRISFEDANEIYCNEVYQWLGSIAYDVKYDAWLVANAAYQTLGNALGTSAFQIQNITRETSDQSLNYSKADFAFSAMMAYSTLNENKPSDWMFPKRKIFPLIYDNSKKLEFWKWWLSEAIPQAWELTGLT